MRASAKRFNERVETKITPACIDLTLSEDEANMLMDVLNCVGGCPQKTRRRFAETVRSALYSVSIRGKGVDDMASQRAIYFAEKD